MATPVGAYGCPSCGTSLGPYELVCPTCGAKVKQLLRVDNLPPKMRELHNIANGAIAQACMYIANAHRLGVKVHLAEDLIAMAKKAATQGDFAVALDLASKSGEEAETLTIQFEALQNRTRQAQRAIAAAREEGGDVSDSEELLEMANEAAIAGDYKSALRYTLKATQRAQQRIGQRQAWKVEIGDWLK